MYRGHSDPPAVRPGIRAEAVPAWRSLGADVAVQTSQLLCQADPAPFFSDDDGDLAAAIDACSSCPIQQPCRAFAVANEERHGIWGGVEFGRKTRQRKAKVRQAAQTQHTRPPSLLVSASSLDTQTGAIND